MEARRQGRDAGKNKRGIRPRAFLVYWSFYGLSKDQRRRIFAGWSLHGFFTVFTKTACIVADRPPVCEDSVSIVHDVPASLYPCDDAVGKAPRNRLFCIEIAVFFRFLVDFLNGVAGVLCKD